MIYCCLQHVSGFICVSSLNFLVVRFYSMFPAQIYILTCSYVQIYMLRVFMPCFNMFYASFSSRLMLGFHAHMFVMPCLDLCVYALFSMFHASIYIYTCLYAWIHVLQCLSAKFLYAYMRVSMFFVPRSMFPHACVLGSMFFTCFMLFSMCLCVPCHVCSPFVALSFFLVFQPSGQDLIQTLWSLSSSIHQGPHKRIWIILFVCRCWLASMLYACASFSSSRRCHI